VLAWHGPAWFTVVWSAWQAAHALTDGCWMRVRCTLFFAVDVHGLAPPFCHAAHTHVHAPSPTPAWPPAPRCGARFGRAPSVFKAENVRVRRGKLQLKSRRDIRYEYPPNPPGMPVEPRVYGNWTTSFVESRNLATYGFFQTKAKYVWRAGGEGTAALGRRGGAGRGWPALAVALVVKTHAAAVPVGSKANGGQWVPSRGCSLSDTRAFPCGRSAYHRVVVDDAASPMPTPPFPCPPPLPDRATASFLRRFGRRGTRPRTGPRLTFLSSAAARRAALARASPSSCL